MFKIGILGQSDVSDILSKLYKTYDKKIFVSNNNPCFVLNSILNEKVLTDNFTERDILLLNPDDKESFKMLKNNSTRIITYGLNSKACVTASSICEEECKHIQFCIQRSFPTFSGKFVEEQEFPIKVDTDNDVNTILAGVTAALINDFDIENIKSCIL